MPDGTKYAFHGQVVDTGSFDNTKVDAEGTLHRRDRKGENAAILGPDNGRRSRHRSARRGPGRGSRRSRRGRRRQQR